MNNTQEKKYIDISFKASLLLKGINAGLEIFFGIITIFLTQTFVINLATYLTQDELLEDPKDKIANYFLTTAQQFSLANKEFIILYLLIHGIVKLLLVIALWKRKLWAYPVSIVIFSLFVSYQIYRYTFSHSLWLIVLSAFDIVVLWFIWKEYQYMKSNLHLVK